MRLEHPIFQGPLEVEIELEEVDTPEGYRKYPGGDELGAKIATWKVHEGQFPDIDVGLVSDPYGFEDSPDAEWISSGVNSKGPSSMALGRQGNLFLWGFYGDPTRLTESGKRVFLNTIVYMKQFDGYTRLVDKVERSREWAHSFASFVSHYTDESGNVPSWVQKRFPPAVWERFGPDVDALTAYYRENVEYLRAVGDGFEVDADLVALEVSNRQLAFFDAVLARLEADPHDDLALRLAGRYVGKEHGTSADALKAWVGANREFLFFSDLGGFRWFVDHRARQGAQRRPAVIEAASSGGD